MMLDFSNDELVAAFDQASDVQDFWVAETERLEEQHKQGTRSDRARVEAAYAELSERMDRTEMLLTEMLRRGLAERVQAA